MKKINLNEFATSSHQEWQDKILVDLKGKELSSLHSETPDGIKIQPNYSQENTPNGSFSDFVTDSVKLSHTRESWYINQEFNCRKPAKANIKMITALNAGVDSIRISVPYDIDFNTLFKDVLPAHIEVRFKNASYELIKNYYLWCLDKEYDTTTFEGTFEVFYHRMENLDERIELAQKVLAYFPKMSLVNVNGDYFFNQGSTNIQQIAISMALANEVLTELVENGIAPNDAAKLISFSFATGSDYFSEIAKFRAFKALWQVVLKEYGVENHATQVHGITSSWNQTILDLNNNMLRSATQALSAVIGGCQSITVLPFDDAIRWSNDFSERMARNTQLIIRDEAFAGKVVDAASGSYFIEKLTSEIAIKSWDLFIEIEDLGGFKTNMDNGNISKWISANRDASWEKAKSGETTVLGVNKYPNGMESKDALFAEKAKHKIKGVRLSDAINN
ncbi:MAG: methylmalonyl-CoA mutase [Dokdonia sp.]|jgi:methylmalonyl-CoA mutase